MKKRIGIVAAAIIIPYFLGLAWLHFPFLVRDIFNKSMMSDIPGFIEIWMCGVWCTMFIGGIIAITLYGFAELVWWLFTGKGF